MILHIKNPKDSTKTLLELINSVKLQGTKSMHKNLLCFLYTSKSLEIEIKKTIPFTIAF